MSWRTVTTSWRQGQHARGWRQVAAILTIGLALLIAACGTSTGGGAPPPTPKPTPSPTPVPYASWRIVASPNAPQHQMSVLYSVSALSASAAWVVGSGYNESSQAVASLIERWDGSAWQVVANAGTDELHGIAALSTTDIWAVGGYLNYGGRMNPNQPLIMHWNGTQWSIVPGVRPADANAVQLDAVAALASNDVWAVGRQDVGAAHLLQPLIERWDGTAWHAVTAPVPSGARESELQVVTTVPGTKQLWAVGSAWYTASPDYSQSLIERWDGTAWQVVPGPTLPSGTFSGELHGVVALSATDAWAVGSYTAGNHTVRTLIAHWNGTTWTVVTSPDTWGTLASVAAASAHDVRAVGSIASGDGNNQHVFVEQWNGTAWQTVMRPEPGGASHSGLTSITSDGAGNFWAVGSYRNAAGNSQTLTLHCP